MFLGGNGQNAGFGELLGFEEWKSLPDSLKKPRQAIRSKNFFIP
jgi:hypothetical protein